MNKQNKKKQLQMKELKIKTQIATIN